ncbi:MAG: hypothetical protein BGO44_11220 [Legionella sp. 39-23]|nr:MAG: hypothetical protein BGO44_11220 [Legionella sp. 39-23]
MVNQSGGARFRTVIIKKRHRHIEFNNLSILIIKIAQLPDYNIKTGENGHEEYKLQKNLRIEPKNA